MKAVGDKLFKRAKEAGGVAQVPAYRRVTARDAGLRESWFRDAIFENPELVIGPCRAAGRVEPDEAWLPWRIEHNFGSGPVDVLLVSSYGRVGIVETKLSYNPQRRREVVAQVLDYALALQVEDYDAVDWPALPADDLAPDEADLRECIQARWFLLIVAGDALDARALRLSQAVLSRSMTSEWDLAMIDLNLFEPADAAGEFLIVPELLGTVQGEVRNIVRVRVEGDSPRARVVVEHVTTDEDAPRRSPKIGSRAEFLEMVEREEDRDLIRSILDAFDEAVAASDGAFKWELRAATANLYWRTPSDTYRRIFAISRRMVFRTWLGYLQKGGYEEQAEMLHAIARRLVDIPAGDQSGRVVPSQENLSTILSVINEAVLALRER